MVQPVSVMHSFTYGKKHKKKIFFGPNENKQYKSYFFKIRAEYKHFIMVIINDDVTYCKYPLYKYKTISLNKVEIKNHK